MGATDAGQGREGRQYRQSAVLALFRMKLGAVDVAALHGGSDRSAAEADGRGHVGRIATVQVIAMHEIKRCPTRHLPIKRSVRRRRHIAPSDIGHALARAARIEPYDSTG